jgi:uncharacterized membrane protein
MAIRVIPLLGALVAATGAAHFAVPETFEQVSRTAFPDDTRDWVLRNGATEVALGVAMISKRTRKIGVLGLLGYTGWLVSRVTSKH